MTHRDVQILLWNVAYSREKGAKRGRRFHNGVCFGQALPRCLELNFILKYPFKKKKKILQPV